jgi:hypothetical protein
LGLLNAYRPHLLDIRQAHQNLLHPVHLQGAHAVGHGLDEDIGHSGAFLDEFFNGVVGYQQLVQAYAAFVASVFAFLAAAFCVGTCPTF